MGDTLEQSIRERAERAIQEKVFPCCVIGTVVSARYRSLTPVHEQSSVRMIVPIGHLTYEKIQSVQEDTVYDLASITKSIPLASLVLMLISENKLSLQDPIKKFLPELQNDHNATIEDLLRYRVTGPRLSQLQFKTFEEIRTYVMEYGFDLPRRSLAAPARSFTGRRGEGGRAAATYSNLPAFHLGIIVERIAGNPPAGGLPALANKYFFEPLRMNNTTFFPEVTDASISTGRQILMRADSRIAPTEIVNGVEIRGIVHDESARVFARAHRAVGHAGLFSTAPDLLKFAEALFNGKLNSVVAGAVHVGHRMSYIVDGAQKGLGWEVNKEWMGAQRSPNTFGKTGFTGTSILCDIENGIGLVILSNRTYPKRPPDNSAINAFRADVANIIFAGS